MKLQNFFPREDIYKKVVSVSKYIAEEVRAEDRDEALFCILDEIEKHLRAKGDSFSIHFTCSEFIEKLIEKSRSGRYVVGIQDSCSLKLLAGNG
jgi:hypothetical protein